jgi:hypothetical protein
VRAAGWVCVVALAAHGALPATVRASQATVAEQDSGAGERTTAAGRDPFVPPQAEPPDTPAPIVAVARPTGLAGLSIDEIVLRGVLIADGRTVAFVQGPGTRQYVLRPGERVRDGSMEAVLPDAVVMRADPGTPGEQTLRQVRITLRRPTEQR